jgi:Zn-finger nucleic acid-binding protein
MSGEPLAPMRCASCQGPLTSQPGRHGIVWVCGRCVAGATTIGVLRHVAPRAFIHHLWQAARHHGAPSRKACPSCTQPLLELRPPQVQIQPALDVCCRCFLIWMERPALDALRMGAAALPARTSPESGELDARRALGGAADAVLAALRALPAATRRD